MNVKTVYAALYYLYTGNDPYSSIFKVKTKKENEEDKSHSLL